jgi:hypothetical protein
LANGSVRALLSWLDANSEATNARN